MGSRVTFLWAVDITRGMLARHFNSRLFRLGVINGTGVSLLIALLGSSRPCFADESPESLIAQGVELRRKGNDAQAEGYFKRAYDLAHTPRSAAQLALVELALSEFFHAEKHFAEAMTNQDAWIREQRKTLDGARETTRKNLGSVRVAGLPRGGSFEVSLPDAAGPEPMNLDEAQRLWLPVGKVSVKALAPGYQESRRSFVVLAGQTQDWKTDLAPQLAPPRLAGGHEQESSTRPGEASPASMPAIDEGRPFRYTGLALVGVGAGATIAGFVLHTVAGTKADHIVAAANNGQAYNPADGNWRTENQLGVGLIVGGLASATGGALLYFLNRSASNSEATSAKTEATVGVSFLPAGARAIVLQGRF